MHWWDWIDIVLVFVSAAGAWKSWVYYDKSKALTIYAKTNIAFIESKTIIATLTEMLKLSSNTRKRGTNYIKEVSRNGEIIKNSITKIRENIQVKDWQEISQLLDSQEIKIETYIDSFITGSVLVNNKLVIDDNFNKCQQKFCDLQVLLKRKLEDTSEKIK